MAVAKDVPTCRAKERSIVAPPMWPLPTASRTTGKLALALLLTAMAVPISPGHAQSGTGLYEPFPEAAVKKRAQRYVEGLSSRTAAPGRRYSDAELATGAFVNPDASGAPLRPAAGTVGLPATRRAGGGAKSEVPLPLQLALLALVLGGTAAITLSRGRAREA